MSCLARSGMVALGVAVGAAVGFIAQSFLTDHGDDRFVTLPDAWWGVGTGAAIGGVLFGCVYQKCCVRDEYEGIYTGSSRPRRHPGNDNRRQSTGSTNVFVALPVDTHTESLLRSMEEGQTGRDREDSAAADSMAALSPGSTIEDGCIATDRGRESPHL